MKSVKSLSVIPRCRGVCVFLCGENWRGGGSGSSQQFCGVRKTPHFPIVFFFTWKQSGERDNFLFMLKVMGCCLGCCQWKGASNF